MAIGRGVGAPSELLVEPTENDTGAAHYTFRIVVPPVSIVETPHGADVHIPGFDTRERRVGAPDLPVKTVLVAIPHGSTPTLELRAHEVRRLSAVRPRPVPERRSSLFQDAANLGAGDEQPFGAASERKRHLREQLVHAEATEFFAGDDLYPARRARLGRIGVLREQRYVEVHLAPVQFDPGSGGLRVTSSLELTVRFQNDDGRRASRPAHDRFFESVYREAFVNYAQGRSFRDPGDAAGAGGDGPGESAASLAASGPRQRIRVHDHAVVRLDYDRMSATPFVSENLSTWKLTFREVEVPLEVFETGTPNDLLEPGEWVQFWGQALDDEPKTELNTDFPGSRTDLYEARDFSDVRVYFLTVEAGPRARMPTADATPGIGLTPPGDFEAVAHAEVDDAFRPLGAVDPWYWIPTQSNPAVNSLVPNRNEVVALPGLASGTQPADVTVRLRGVTEDFGTNPDHKTRVTLRNQVGTTLAVNDDDGTFDGRVIYDHTFTWTFPGSGPTLTDPAQIFIEALSVPGAPGAYNNQLILDWIEIRYRRLFQALNDVLVFDWPDEDVKFQVDGLSSSNVAIYELTGRVGTSGVVDPVRLTGASTSGGGGNFSATFEIANDPGLADGTMRSFAVLTDGAVTVPVNADFEADTVSDLRNATKQADLIVIAHEDVLGPLSQPVLNQLLSYHAGRDISSEIVMLEDVEDEFNDGLPGPAAIENFLSWVMTPGDGWALPKPAFVLLLGDGSYDYKGGPAQGNFVPTQLVFQDLPELGFYASDSLMAAVLGNDQLADLVAGRISARTDDVARRVLQKALDYQQAPPPGNWTRHALVISDRGKNFNPDEAREFENTNAAALGVMKTPPHTRRNLRYWSDYCDTVNETCSPAATEQFRQDIKDAVNGADAFDGAAVVQDVSHGNFDVWSDDAYFDDRQPDPDSDDLNNVPLPFLMAHNCLSGGFHTTAATSLGENWLKRDGGGAVAVFSPSGLSFGFLGRTASDVVWDELYGPPKARTLAAPVMRTLTRMCTDGATEACQNYVLLGDPALDLAIDSVDPPKDLTATGGNTVVDLTWTQSTTPDVTYDLYRSTRPDRDYALAASGLSGGAYQDSGRTNAVTYYYYLFAIDPQGFESAWSNFNSDCGAAMPEDCVQATPLNPNPPATPSGFTAIDAESGGRLDLSWDPNPEQDLSYYEVLYGFDPLDDQQPCPFDNTVNVGKVTSYALTGLQNDVEYCLAITATNTSDLTSNPSAEVVATPHLVLGNKTPRFIDDLRLDKSGTDALLTWSDVTLDIYGKPFAADHYEVFRGTTPDFTPSLANRIGTPPVPSFTDAGALAPGEPDYHYLVRAVEAGGTVGGLGYQVPDRILSLRLDRSTITPGNLVLSWDAVSSAVDGSPTRIAYYEVYAEDQPISRDQICDLAQQGCSGLTPLTTTGGLSVEVTPPAQSRYYSVLAVDTRGNRSPF